MEKKKKEEKKIRKEEFLTTVAPKHCVIKQVDLGAFETTGPCYEPHYPRTSSKSTSPLCVRDNSVHVSKSH
jgi:hypothetical protein